MPHLADQLDQDVMDLGNVEVIDSLRVVLRERPVETDTSWSDTRMVRDRAANHGTQLYSARDAGSTHCGTRLAT